MYKIAQLGQQLVRNTKLVSRAFSQYLFSTFVASFAGPEFTLAFLNYSVASHKCKINLNTDIQIKRLSDSNLEYFFLIPQFPSLSTCQSGHVCRPFF